ncbi:hypothetical protein Tco_1293832 [Tanacetum coccineum]
MLQDVKSYLGRCFAMKDLGEAAYILRIKIYRDRSKQLIDLCQSAYIEKILKRYFMENSKRGTIPMQEKLKLSKSQSASTPAKKQRMKNVPYASAVGSIMYAIRCELHWTTVKNILKYLRNTKDMFLVYGGDMKRKLRVSCYTDAGYLTDADDLKSQTRYVFILNRGVVDWKSTKTHKMYCDNTGAISIAKESGITKGARHYRAKVHYLREVIRILVTVKAQQRFLSQQKNLYLHLIVQKDTMPFFRLMQLMHAIAHGSATPTPKWELLDYVSWIRKLYIRNT